MTNETLAAALDYGITVLANNARRLTGFPHTTERGHWRQSEHGRWTAGFWIGTLWIAYLCTGDFAWQEEAEKWSRRLEPRKVDRTTHDMGFLFQPSFVRGWKITGDPYYREVAITACTSHASRYHAVGRFIPAWDPSEDPIFAGRTIVDTSMNLPLLYWGAQNAHHPAWATIADAVADTTRNHHVRDDGSTYHVVDFDPATGAPLRYTTHQGRAPDSCWTRGQAWAIYGFTQIYEWSGRPEDLTTAMRLADYFIAHLPADNLPFWDFQASPESGEPRDSSAAAIAASGLLELARVLGDTGTRYYTAALSLLEVLGRRCLSRGEPNQDGILLHGTVDQPHHSGIDESIIYGDHYFLEALCKILRPDRWDLL